MEEYKRLYKLYLQKTDSELNEIINPKNGYTSTAIKAATDVLKFERVDCEEAIRRQGGVIEMPCFDDEKTESSKICQGTPIWSLVLIIINSLICITVITLAFAYSIHTYNSKAEPISIVEGNYYDGSGDYFGLVFYFQDKNTYICTTSSGNNFAYGTYEIDGNALKLNIASESYAGVVVADGEKIMINNSALNEITDSTIISKYESVFKTINAK